MTDPNIELEFLKFRTVAEKGYQLANKKYEEIESTLQKAERHIKLANNEQNQLQGLQTTALISGQDEELKELRQNMGDIRKIIDALREESKDFSIVIYGRKLAGKSTLMEILTHGDGKSIGKGTKRAITDIRTYRWHGLKVTDISGFDFSDGGTNDILKTADVILFLMTNDAPLAEEAESFAHLKSFGKPILGVINVRKILNFKRRDLILQELNKILPDAKEIQSVIEKFKKLAKNYDQDWSNIKFLPTHLLAAFYARLDRVNDEEIYTASNFVAVENLILGKILTDGKFLHMKNFIDSVAIPMNDMLLKLFKHSANSLRESKIWAEQSEKISSWRKAFWEIAQSKLHRLFNKLSENLKKEIPRFAEDHYGTDHINEQWHSQMQKFGYIERYQDLLESLSSECKTKLQKFIDELTQELKTSLGCKTHTDLEIEDKKTFGKYSAIVLPNLLTLMPEMGWTDIAPDNTGTFFYQSFFDNQAGKSNGKETLREQLVDSSFKMLTAVNNKSRDILNKQVLSNVDEFAKLVTGYAYMLARLGESQSEMAEALLGEYEELNAVLVADAVKYKGAGKLSGVKVTLRIPGEVSVVIADGSSVDTQAISALMGEKFYTVIPLDSWDDTMKKMLDCDFELDSYSLDSKSDSKTYSVTPKEEISDEKIKLAQQISPYPIIAF